MKYLIFLFCISFSLSSLACSCIGEGSFCSLIKSDYFSENGIVCIVEPTGNVSGDYDFSAAEVKIVELLFGQVQPGNGNYLNTDSTIWIIAGQGATCYESAFIFYNPDEQFVMASTYGEVYKFDNTKETGYSLYLCTHDVFRYTDTMIGPIINDYSFFPYTIHNPDTITINQLPQVVDSCAVCLNSLTLSDKHDFPSIYSASSTILSTADINSNVVYRANDRITLFNGFKTNLSNNFSVRMDGCD